MKSELPKNCFSLWRLAKKLNDEPPVEPFWVGGQLRMINSEELLLFGQGVTLRLAASEATANLQVYDLVAFLISKPELSDNSVMSAQVHKAQLIHRTEQAWHLRTNADTHRKFLNFQKLLADCCDKLGLEPIQTPSLVRCPGYEPTLEPFSTELKFGSQRTKLFLPTSPEIHLKKLLSQGYSDIYQLSSCFRNEEASATHEPEFIMLEWYRAYADLTAIESDLQSLLNFCASNLQMTVPAIKKYSLSEMFAKQMNFDFKPDTTKEELFSLANANGIEVSPSDDFNDIFHRLMIERIEPSLELQTPTLLYNFPPSQAAMAELDAQGWAMRFELYWQGLEIANAYFELTDPAEQWQRISADLSKRKQNNQSPIEHDEDFIHALKHGLPPSAGIALGVDRLFMAFMGVKDISELRAFSYGGQLRT